MSQNLKVVNINDFTGGLNLRRDAFLLAMNESPDCLNVDVDPRGGFHMRRGTSLLNPTATSAPITALAQYSTTAGIQQLLASYGTKVGFATTTNFTDITGITQTATLPIRSVTFKDNAYLFNGKDVPWRWNGSTATQLTDATTGSNFNDNIQVPLDNGRGIIAKYATTFQGSVWLANTTEAGGAFPNRLRFSHPNHPEDWRSFDFIDVDTGSDGDVIVGLLAFQDRLLVFKRHSIYAIYGFDANTFRVYPITHDQGAVGQDAIVSTDMGVYFFSWPRGVFLYDGKKIEWLFEKLYPAVADSNIPDSWQNVIALGWHVRRLWVSVPWGGSSVNAKTFVLDPTIKGGPWVEYDLAPTVHLEWVPPGGIAQSVAAFGSHVCLLEQNKGTDNIGGVFGETAISSYYVTGWEDLKQPAITKQWKRPEFVIAGGANASILVSVYRNYDPSVAHATFRLATTADPSSAIWNTDQWDYDPLYPAENLYPAETLGEGNVSTDVWGRSGTVYDEILRGASLGTARSVRLRFDGPTASVPWGIDGFALKFIPKRLRP